MKMNYGVILTAMLATGAMAQTAPPPLTGPDTTPPAATSPTPAPAAKSATEKPAVKPKAAAKKAPAKKPAKTVPVEALGAPFLTNDLAVSKQNNVRVRAKALINSEIVMMLKEGQTVTTLGETNLAHPKTDEPSRWVKIALPEGTHVYVHTSYLEGGTTVKPKDLNIRSGPGENYTVVGMLHKGDTVKSVSTKGDWTEIEAPTGSYGFVAAHLLAHKEVPAPPIEVATAPVVTPVPNGTGNTVAPPVEPTPVTPAPMTAPVPAPAPEPMSEQPPPPRIVQREGVVGDVVSIQAPTYFQLQSLDTGKALNYLYPGSTNLPPMTRYRNHVVLVSGEESLDERWPNTPVLTIERIQVLK